MSAGGGSHTTAFPESPSPTTSPRPPSAPASFSGGRARAGPPRAADPWSGPGARDSGFVLSSTGCRISEGGTCERAACGRLPASCQASHARPESRLPGGRGGSTMAVWAARASSPAHRPRSVPQSPGLSGCPSGAPSGPTSARSCLPQSSPASRLGAAACGKPSLTAGCRGPNSLPPLLCMRYGQVWRCFHPGGAHQLRPGLSEPVGHEGPGDPLSLRCLSGSPDPSDRYPPCRPLPS